MTANRSSAGFRPRNDRCKTVVQPSMVNELRIALTVESFEEALAFYRDALGLEVLELWQTPGSTGALLAAGRATLELFDEGQACMVDELEVGRRVAGPVRIAFDVEDSAAVAGVLERAGAEHLGGPVVTPWGDRNVRVRAPDGMQLTLFTGSNEGSISTACARTRPGAGTSHISTTPARRFPPGR